jgi:hypothetical protein
MMDFPNSCRRLKVGKDITISWKIAFVKITFVFFFSLSLSFYPHIVDVMGCQVKSATSKHRKHPLPHFQEEVQV